MTERLEASSETGPWDQALAQLQRWDAGWADTCAKMTTNPWHSRVLPRKTVELVGGLERRLYKPEPRRHSATHPGCAAVRGEPR